MDKTATGCGKVAAWIEKIRCHVNPVTNRYDRSHWWAPVTVTVEQKDEKRREYTIEYEQEVMAI